MQNSPTHYTARADKTDTVVPYRVAPQNAAPAPANMLFDLPLLWTIFRRRLPLFLGSALAVVALVLLITLQMTPRYSARATIIIDPTQNAITDVTAILAGGTADSAAVDTQVEIMKSRKIAEKVAGTLDLYSDPEFNPGLGEKSGGLKGLIKGLMPGQFDKAPDSEMDAQLARERVVNAVQERVTVEREGLTYVISVIFESVDPVKAAQIANTFTDQFLDNQFDTKFDKLRKGNESLQRQIEQQRVELRVAEEKVQAYRIANNLLDAAGISLTEQQVSDVYTQLTVKQAELAADEARLNNMNARSAQGESLMNTAEVISSPVISELRAKEADIGRRKSELLTRYGPLHPSVKKINNEEAELNAQIRSEVNRIVASLQSQVNVAKKEVQGLQSNLDLLSSELAGNNDAMVGLRELEREAASSRELYEALLTRAKATAQFGELADANAEPGSLAAIPTGASFPNKFLNLILGMILGGGVGAMLVMLTEIFDNGIRTAEDVEKSLGTEMITAIPTLDERTLTVKGTEMSPEDYLVERPLSAFAESYRALRSSINHQASTNDRAKIVALTSSLSGEGKTVSALALGRVCAMSGDKVIVIDCDLRRRILSGGLQNVETGLVEVLTGKGALRDAIMKDEKTELHILPVSASPQEVTDIFGSKGFDAMLARLKSKFDVIILDTAPVTAVAESRAVVSAADISLLIIRWRKTSVRVAHSAAKILRGLPTPFMGVLLTQVDSKAQTQYGYEGSSAYFDSHKKYYHD